MRQRFALMFVGLALVTGLSIACTRPTPSPTEVIMSRLDPAGVASVRMAGAVGLNPLQMERAADRRKIEKIVRWLNTAEYVSNRASTGMSPDTQLEITRQDGRIAVVTLAGDCTLEQQGEKQSLRCSNPPGQVVFQPGNGEPAVRLRSSELAEWLSIGWRADFGRE